MMLRVVEVGPWKLAAPAAVDRIAYPLREFIGKRPLLDVAWPMPREGRRNALAGVGRVGVHEEDGNTGIALPERAPIRHVLETRGAVDRPEREHERPIRMGCLDRREARCVERYDVAGGRSVPNVCKREQGHGRDEPAPARSARRSHCSAMTRSGSLRVFQKT